MCIILQSEFEIIKSKKPINDKKDHNFSLLPNLSKTFCISKRNKIAGQYAKQTNISTKKEDFSC
jgi:hypothetical protein